MTFGVTPARVAAVGPAEPSPDCPLCPRPELCAVLALGRIAHESVVRALGMRLAAVPFAHGRSVDLSQGGRALRLFSSYHCSRYNTNTGVLTTEMFRAVFADVRSYLDGR